MIDNAEYPEFCSEQTHIARKQHRCGECKRTIEAGEKYHVTSGKWDGEFQAYKTCAHCVSARSWLAKHCGGWVLGAVAEEIDEHWVNGIEYRRQDRLGRLVVGIRRQWKAFKGGLLPVPAPLAKGVIL